MKPALWLLATLAVMAESQAATHPCESMGCIDAVVVGVTDGDTVTLLVDGARGPEQSRLRLTEIDTPERGQPWGTRARRALADKVFQRRVRVASEGEDRYGRLLGRIYVEGRDVNREMVQEGHAWVYRRYSSDIWLLEDERAAKDAGVGLWSLPATDQVPPWEWRRGGRRSTGDAVAAIPTNAVSGNESFLCGAKTYCREMASCEEAQFHLRQCGLVRLDGDGDDTPCESLCVH